MADSLRPAWNVAHQAPLSMGFPGQDSWSGLPFPAPGGLPHPGSEPTFPALAAAFFTPESPGKPHLDTVISICLCVCVCVCVSNLLTGLDSLVVQVVKCLSATQETRVQLLGREDPLEKEMVR